MADNVILNPGEGGATIATDEIDGVQHQVVLVEFGVDGEAIRVSEDNPLPVTGTVAVSGTVPVSAASLPLPTDAAKESKQDAGNTLLDAIGSTLVAGFSAVVSALTDKATATLQGTANTSLASILTALASQATAALQTAGNALLTTIDAKLGGTLTVDGSGHTQPVSGTVTANAGTNLNTSLLALEGGGNLATCATQTTNCATSLGIVDDWDETDRCKVNLIVGQAGIAAGTGVDGVTVPRVSLATNVPLPAGTNAIGKLSANSGVVIGDVNAVCTNAGVFACQDSQVVADNAGFTDGTTKLFVSGYIYDEAAGTALSENDAAAARIDSKRAQINVIEDGTTRGRWATVGSDGRLSVNAKKVPTTATHSNVSGSASSVTILASNANRINATIQNDSTARLYLKLGGTASATSFFEYLDQGDLTTLPIEEYGTGDIVGIWASATGSARVLEMT